MCNARRKKSSLHDSNPNCRAKACEIVVLPCCVKESGSEVKTDVNTTSEAHVLQLKMVNFRYLVHFFPPMKGEPRVRCTRWCLGHETLKFIVLWETLDAEVEDGPLLWKLMEQRYRRRNLQGNFYSLFRKWFHISSLLISLYLLQMHFLVFTFRLWKKYDLISQYFSCVFRAI